MSDELQRNQPCGCIVCVCEDNEQCHGCGAKHCGTHPIGEIPNPAYIPMTPHAMTMEQVITLESGGQGAVNVALRLCQTLTQQAQEVERLKVDLQEHRTICRKATQAIIDAIGSDGPENIDHAVDRLIAKLATMMAERDEQGKLKADLYERFLEAQKQLITQDIQLEASQARVRELEQPKFTVAPSDVVDYLSKEVDQLLPMLGVETALVTDMSHVGDFPDEQLGAEKYIWQAAIDLLRNQLATLQATLAERERQVALFKEYQKRCDGIEDNLAESITENEQLAVERDTARQDAARLREALEAHMQLAAKICYAEPELSQYRAMTEQAQRAMKGA
jgi:DNA repair exonuclease SbcCD ATPase subunit